MGIPRDPALSHRRITSGNQTLTVATKLLARLTLVELHALQIPLAYACLLYKVRNKLINSEISPLASALRFLHEPFKPQYFWWELVLVAQKLIIVGFFVLEPFKPGSFIQLMLGMSVVLVFTVVQMQVQPYRNRRDNLLATTCNVSLFSFFLGSVLFRFHELTTDFDAVSAQLTSEWASKRFTLSFELISALMIFSLLGSILMMIALECLEFLAPNHIDVFRWNLDDSQVVPPLLMAEQFHTFLSHNWATGQDQARSIKGQLSSLVPGLKVWLGE